MRALRPIVSVVTLVAFFVQMTGLAHASPPQDEVQPVPYNPSQPVPVPAQPSYAPAPGPSVVPAPMPPPGYARSGPGGDAIFLKGGGMMRGTMIEMLPNDHVTLQLPTGQNAIIEWGKIEHIERGAGAPAVLPPMAGGLMAPPQARRAPGGSVVVHVEADQGAVLESVAPGSGRWMLVCAAPCDAQVPLGRQYRIGGEGLRPSRPFGIEAAPGQHVEILVATGTRAGFAGGLALTSVGAAAIIVGLTVLLFGALASCDTTDEFGNCIGSADGGLETAGAILSIAGVTMIVGGAILMASNARTKATLTLASLLPPSPTRPETAWLRAPLWHDSIRVGAAGLPGSTGIPLFAHSF